VADREFTDDQLIEAIGQAIRARRFDVARDVVALLARQNPRAAQNIVDVLNVAAGRG